MSLPYFVADFVLLCRLDSVTAEGADGMLVGEFSVAESGESVAPLLPRFCLRLAYWKAAPLRAGLRVWRWS